jgi:hypothetical protein
MRQSVKMPVNPAATSFKPEMFTGKNPALATSWWKKLKAYLRIAEVDEDLCCSLTRLLLGDEAEKWFNFLPEATQRDFKLLEKAFIQQYIQPQTQKLTRLAELRGRVQAPHESLREFLVDIGSNLKAICYNRELWLDLIFPALKPQLQAAISSFGTEEIKTFGNLMESAEKIEGIASALGSKNEPTMKINNVQSDNVLHDNKLDRTLSTLALL